MGCLLVFSFFLLPGTAADSSWIYGTGYRLRNLSSSAGQAGFTSLKSPETGVTFTNQLSEWSGSANRVLLNGSGVAVGDFDNDGWVDLFFCGLETPNALYRNLGNWKFQNVTTQSGLNFAGNFFRGAVFADLNGDRWLDLLVTTTGRGVLCFQNEQGKFRDVTATAGTGSSYGSVALALADVDGNGSLDLYIGNNRADDIRDRGQVDLSMVKGQVIIPPQFEDRLLFTNKLLVEYGEPDQLLLNDGHGRFRSVPWNGGSFLDELGRPLQKAPHDWALTATFRDVNNDGWPDLYVCNDFWTPDRFWINDGKGRFKAIDPFAWRSMSASSMGVDFADLDRDGSPEFFVVDMLSRDPRLRKRQMPAQQPSTPSLGLNPDRPQVLRNTLFHNRGDGTFAEIAHFARLTASDWSWCPIFLDVDLDGFEDLLITAGHVSDVQDLDAETVIKTRQKSYRGFTNAIERLQAFVGDKMANERLYPPLALPIVAFRNNGQLQFEEKTDSWGTGEEGVHQGFATGDFDNDGDLDLVVNSFRSTARVFRNEGGGGRVAVRLKGKSPNTQGIGARVKLLNGAVPMQNQEIVSGGRYLSGSDPVLAFATGTNSSGMSLEVRWRGGIQTVIRDVRANRLYEIEEIGEPAPAAVSTPAKPWFQEWGSESGPPSSRRRSEGRDRERSPRALLGHRHAETTFDDFSRQPLLPFKLSQAGPGVAWAELNADNLPDLIVGAGSGATPVVFLSEAGGKFSSNGLSLGPVGLEWTGVAVSHSLQGTPMLLFNSSNYESGQTNGGLVTAYDWEKKKVAQVFGPPGSSGPMALGDLEGDGTLELFVGGSVSAGRYPESDSSYLFRRLNDQWLLDSKQKFPGAGQVNGATFTDLNGDGLPELVLACAWGPIRVFRNVQGSLKEVTSEWGLGNFTGLWNSVASADLDGDGDFDLVAGNWGLNSEFQASPQAPLQLYYGDLMQRRQLDLIESEWVAGQPAPVRMFHELVAGVPSLVRNFKNHKTFSEQTLPQLFQSDASRLRTNSAHHLASTVFMNQGTGFVARPLPAEAQWSPAFGVILADFDGDGAQDMVLSQNFFATRPGIGRLDAGRGLLLRGHGDGNFSAVTGQESGVRVYGEQRGSAMADYDHDGRMDLVITQNAAETKLFRNEKGEPGWRVRLKGAGGNPTAVGGSIRLLAAGKGGAAREVQAGSGYWSQNSATVLLSPAPGAEKISVRWPGGRVTETAISGKPGLVEISAP